MTVQELIDKLMKVEDKSKDVEYYANCGTDYEDVTQVIEYTDTVILS